MQAVKAYYSKGQFIPLGLGQLAEGTEAIITVLDSHKPGVKERLKEFDRLCSLIDAAADEEMPVIERVKFREVGV